MEIPRELRTLTASEVGELLHMTETTVYRKAREGLMPCVYIGRTMRFQLTALERWMAEGGSRYEGRWRKEID